MADVDLSVRHAKLRDLAGRWCGGAEVTIRDALGEVSGYDRSVFYLAACAEMGARAYDAVIGDKELLEHSGVPPEELAELPPETRRMAAETAAQTLLRSVFALMGGLIRQKGHAVQMSAKVSFSKVDNFRARTAPEPEPEPAVCRCALDQDGRCAECAALSRGFLMAILESTRAMTRFDRSRPICPSCAKVCLDGIFARIVRDEFSGLDPSVSETFMNALLLGSQSLAAMELPLTKRAWSEVQRGGKA